MPRLSVLPALTLPLLALTVACGAEPAPAPEPAADPTAYRAEVETWRAERLERLQAEDGWLALVGLHWLTEGANVLGSAPDAAVVLPTSAPPRLGTVVVADGRARFDVAPGADVRHDGERVRSLELAPDTSGKPTVLTAGTLSMLVIERGGRLALRVRDAASPARTAFRGIDSYPVDPRWRVVARFEPYAPPRSVPVPTVLGTAEPMTCPGRVVFEIDGRTLALDAMAEPTDEKLFLIFADATNRDATYGGGRFLYAERPGADGTVVLDFNKAYNPPCAFTPYATCPLPPPQNALEVRVEAGEKRWADGHGGHA